MKDQDRKVLEHLSRHFGTQPFTTGQASQTRQGADGSGEDPGLPKDEENWAERLRDMAAQELVVAEAEGWRLIETVLQAAGILNV